MNSSRLRQPTLASLQLADHGLWNQAMTPLGKWTSWTGLCSVTLRLNAAARGAHRLIDESIPQAISRVRSVLLIIGKARSRRVYCFVVVFGRRNLGVVRRII